MPLQNRVTPFGEIVALPGRGTLTGNRGILHNERKEIVRPWQTRRWIACLLEFRGLKREVMQPHRWTQLFFLDEAAALSAGHRPCAYCRNADYKRFQSLWKTVHGEPAGADDLDDVLDASRREGRKKRTYRERLDHLPDGTYVAIDGAPWLVWGNALHAWSDSGYTDRRARSEEEVDVLTPHPIVGILRAGYRPGIHESVV